MYFFINRRPKKKSAHKNVAVANILTDVSSSLGHKAAAGVCTEAVGSFVFTNETYYIFFF